MGAVDEVEDTLSGARVALKKLYDLSPEGVYRLKREFRRLAQHGHPNLVQLFELTADADGMVGFTMELVDGCDFVSHCRQIDCGAAALDEGRVRSSLPQLVAGVRALHERKLLHQDIKPSNVLVSRSDGRVVVVDFGLATRLGASDSATLSANWGGTPAYMAPEQAELGSPLGPAADWYAVGVVLYEVLTGDLPFPGTPYEIVHRKAHAEPPDILACAPAAPRDLALLCSRLLQRRPEERPTGEEIAAMLENGRAPVTINPPPQAMNPRVVGRGEQLGALLEEFDAVRSGASRVALLRGDSGIGKTTILREFIRRAKERDPSVTSLGGRCYQRESIPFRGIDSVMDQLSRLWMRMSRADAMYLLPREPEFLIQSFPVLARVREVAEAATKETATSPEDARIRSFIALRETLQRLARRGPLVLWLDDVQWIDADSVGLLRFTMTQGAEAPPLLLVLVSRPPQNAGSGDAEPSFAPVLSHARIIDVGPLPERDMRTLISEIVGHDDAVVVAAAARATGNPFLGALFARHAAINSGSANADPVEMLARELEASSPHGRTLLELVCLADGPISAHAVAAAAGLTKESAIRELLALESQSLLRLAPGPRADAFEPYHDRVRDWVSQGLNAEGRRELHARLGVALEREHGDSATCFRHFLEAGLIRQAAGHALRAANDAEGRLAFVQAAEHYRTCAELEPPGSPQQYSLRRALADSLSRAGHGVVAADAYLSAAEIGDPAGRLTCTLRAAEELFRCGRSARGLAIVRSVSSSVGLPYPRVTWLAIVALLSWRAFARIGLRFSARRPRSSRATKQQERLDVCNSAAFCLGFADLLMTSYYQALNLRLSLKAGEAKQLARAVAAEAVYVVTGPKPMSQRADQLLATARDLAESANDARSRALVVHFEGTVAFLRGRWREGYRVSREGERLMRAAGGATFWELATAALYTLGSLFMLGDLQTMREILRPKLQEAEARNDLYALTVLRIGYPHILNLADDATALAREEIASVMSLWPAEAFTIPKYWELVDLTHLDLYESEPESALARIRAAAAAMKRSLPMRNQTSRVRVRLAHARAALAVAARRMAPTDALEEAERAIQFLAREKGTWAPALALPLRAGVATLRGDTGAALRLLELAEQGLYAADMSLDASFARRARGRLLGGSGGTELAGSADEWLTSQGIRNTTALARVYVPGLV
jgi:hypothetical protein